jgi:imidazolonepropionase-like amidohydrolase
MLGIYFIAKRYMNLPLAAGFLLVAVSACITPMSSTQKQSFNSEWVALKNVTIIDGKGSPPTPNKLVLIKGDKIYDIGASDNYQIPAGTRVIDLSGRYVLPGLIDMHAHATILPVNNNGSLSSHYDRPTSERILRILLAYGITTIRNPAAPTNDGVELREAVRAGQILGPGILTAGSPPRRTPSVNGPFVSYKTPEDLRLEIRRQAKAGVDFIKVYADMPPDLLEIAIKEAHVQGLKVIGHLQTTTWTEAAQLGIDAITHGAPWSPEYLPPDARTNYPQTMKGRIYWMEHLDLSSKSVVGMVDALAMHGVTVDPTLIAYHTKFWGDDPRYLHHPQKHLVPKTILEGWQRGTFTSDWSQSDYQRAKAAWSKILGLTKMLYDRGVTITAGSDFPNPWVIPGVSLHEELSLLVEAKIPPLQVIKIATLNGATALGLEREIGSVEKGKRADLVVLTADPSKEIRNTRLIEWVILGGRLLTPESMLAEKAEVTHK